MFHHDEIGVFNEESLELTLNSGVDLTSEVLKRRFQTQTDGLVHRIRRGYWEAKRIESIDYAGRSSFRGVRQRQIEIEDDAAKLLVWIHRSATPE